MPQTSEMKPEVQDHVGVALDLLGPVHRPPGRGEEAKHHHQPIGLDADPERQIQDDRMHVRLSNTQRFFALLDQAAWLLPPAFPGFAPRSCLSAYSPGWPDVQPAMRWCCARP